jgi:hypothetical protein
MEQDTRSDNENDRSSDRCHAATRIIARYTFVIHPRGSKLQLFLHHTAENILSPAEIKTPDFSFISID